MKRISKFTAFAIGVCGVALLYGCASTRPYPIDPITRQTSAYSIVPLANPPIRIECKGGESEPLDVFPKSADISYKKIGTNAPARVLVGVEVGSGRELLAGNFYYETRDLSDVAGQFSITTDLCLWGALFTKLRYGNGTTTLRLALFEAISSPDPKKSNVDYGRQVSNPIQVRMRTGFGF